MLNGGIDLRSCKNTFASLFSAHSIIHLSGREQVYLVRLRFERCFFDHRTT